LLQTGFATRGLQLATQTDWMVERLTIEDEQLLASVSRVSVDVPEVGRGVARMQS
jgi:hypothetical protein